MRGALGIIGFRPYARGIIPADAGSTCHVLQSLRSARDHPRGCGEHLACSTVSSPSGGSSPRMRGARMCALYASSVLGIIPADAGSTSFSSLTFVVFEDHPRGCGEHKTVSSTSRGEAGSSPRMRGALTLGQQGCLEHRIIPADAGSTASSQPP